MSTTETHYVGRRTDAAPAQTGHWEREPWRSVEPVLLNHFLGDEPLPRPLTQAKVL